MRTSPRLHRVAAALAIALAPWAAPTAALAGPVIATHGYELVVSQLDGGGAGGNAVYAYNQSTAGSTTGGNGTYSVSGTTDTTGAATQLTASYSAGVQSTSTGSIGMNLADGTLRYQSASTQDGTNYSGGNVYLSMTDTVTFNIAGASASTHTLLNVQYYFDGTLLDGGTRYAGGLPQASIYTYLQFGSLATARATSELNAGNGLVQTTFGDSGVFGGGTWTALSASQWIWNGVLDLVGDSVTLPFSMTLSGYCQAGAVCDYGNTARVAFSSVPAGVTWTSASGVFLTAGTGGGDTDGGSVPEPGSLALVALALAACRPLRRRPA